MSIGRNMSYCQFQNIAGDIYESRARMGSWYDAVEYLKARDNREEVEAFLEILEYAKEMVAELEDDREEELKNLAEEMRLAEEANS